MVISFSSWAKRCPRSPGPEATGFVGAPFSGLFSLRRRLFPALSSGPFFSFFLAGGRLEDEDPDRGSSLAQPITKAARARATRP
jgi:hypothetical protein